MPKFVIGTRDSKLALWQANWVLQSLSDLYPEYEFSLRTFKTQGDKLLDVALSKIGSKGLFTKEIEIALLNKEIDIAVHSMKDLPTVLPEGLTIGAICKREDVRDVLVSDYAYTLDTLPQGAQVGTSSLRRRSQLLNYRPDLEIVDIRGNLDTRIRKLRENGYAAIVLAAAGIERLGYTDLISERISPRVCLPAVGQGALGLEIRADDLESKNCISKLEDFETKQSIVAERTFLNVLEGGCQVPIGTYSYLKDEQLYLEGIVANYNGTLVIKDVESGGLQEGERVGRKLAEKLLAKGAGEILYQIRQGIEKVDG